MPVRCLRYLALLAAFVSSTAFAQDALVLETLQGQRLGDWITAAQRDPSHEGRQVGVLVRRDTSSREIEPCGRYRIEFDPATAPAFEVGPCDPRTNATWLRLLSRVPLFETTSGPLPRPRDDIRVSALVTYGGTETAGGLPEFESRTDCVILERVFERNMLRPQDPPFEFTPPTYRLVPLDPDVQVQAAQNGWLLSRPMVSGRTTSGVRYEIRDAQGRVVLQNRVSKPLECRAAEAQMDAPPPAAPPPSAPRPPPPEPILLSSPSPSGVVSLAGELHGLPIINDGAETFGGGLALGLGAAFTLQLPPWVLLTAKVSLGGGGSGLIGMVTGNAAVSFHLSPMTAIYVGPAARLWGVSYPDSSQVGGLDLGGVAGLWVRYHTSSGSDRIFFIETMAAPWTDSLWTVTVGFGFGGRTY